MNKKKRHIVFATLLLIVFAAGQAVLFTHHHELIKCCGQRADHSLKNGYHEKKQDVKCVLCAAIMNQALLMAAASQLVFCRVETMPGQLTGLNSFLVYNDCFFSRGPPGYAHTKFL